MFTALLVPHATTKNPAITEVAVNAWRDENGALILRYQLNGAIDALLIPSSGKRERADELWRHTCFEAFVAHGEAYDEFNFAPSGAWAAYRFQSYRDGMSVLDIQPPTIVSEQTSQRLVMNVRLSAAACYEVLNCGLCVVIEAKSGAKSYWALAHYGDGPDFHDARCFTAQIG